MASELTQGLSSASLAKFKALQDHFVTGLATRWHAVATAATPHDLHAALHQLSGAAGSYGFERMSQCARSAELLSTGHTATATATATALAQALVLLEAEINLAQNFIDDGSSGG